ncbi:MAG: hypothetical protein HDR71_02570 [Lachnospiraceae bacterium]|nr:hypothetical protein [Lachnospiraceae bacterium]
MKMFFEMPMGNLSDEEMTEKARIREIVEYDRYCTDYGYRIQQKELWHEDGRLFTTWFEGPVSEYLGNPTITPKERIPLNEPVESHGHRVNNTIVWLNGNKAIAELLCFLNFRTNIKGEWMDSQCWCRMHYRLEKRTGRWGIIYFEGIYEKDRMDPVFMDSTLKVTRDELQQYRAVNWNMAYRRGVIGGLKNADRWAGSDVPETLEKLYRESSEWFGLE